MKTFLATTSEYAGKAWQSFTEHVAATPRRGFLLFRAGDVLVVRTVSAVAVVDGAVAPRDVLRAVVEYVNSREVPVVAWQAGELVTWMEDRSGVEVGREIADFGVMVFTATGVAIEFDDLYQQESVREFCGWWIRRADLFGLTVDPHDPVVELLRDATQWVRPEREPVLRDVLLAVARFLFEATLTVFSRHSPAAVTSEACFRGMRVRVDRGAVEAVITQCEELRGTLVTTTFNGVDVFALTPGEQVEYWERQGIVFREGHRRIGRQHRELATVPEGAAEAWDAFGVGRDLLTLKQSAEGLLSHIDGDGFVHPEYREFGAVTGRASVSNPPLQALPKGLRHAVRPTSEGSVFVSVDLKQVDVRCLAALSQDAGLLGLLADGGDPYKVVATELGVSRGAAKEALLAVFYGIGANTLGNRLGVSRGQAEQLLGSVRSRFRGVAEYAGRVMRGVGLVTLGGRHLEAPTEAYKAVNMVAQGSSADVFRELVVALKTSFGQAGVNVGFRLPVHDEVVLEVAEAEVGEVVRLVGETVLNVAGVRFPVEVEVLGSSWAGEK